jgi:hypothetical protein
VTVSVVVPWRSDHGPRAVVWAYVSAWWREHHPDWQLLVGEQPDGGPWCKAAAVAAALPSATGEVLVVADADVICDGVATAMGAITVPPDAPAWAVPHRRVYRLTAAATTVVLAGGPMPDPGTAAARAAGRRPEPAGVEASYTGVAGGGIVVLPRDLYEAVPLDPRFVGWGQEDESWAWALTVLAGKPWRGTADLWHLWHPPVPIGDGGRMTRAVGNPAGYALMRRYLSATTPDQMRGILDQTGADGV